MKNRLMFLILFVFLGVTTVFCQYSNSSQTYKKNKPESIFHLWDCDEWLKLVW